MFRNRNGGNGLSEKQRRRKCLECHFGDDDILVDNFRLNAVHYIDGSYPKNAEYDFYLDTGDDMYLLRLQNISENIVIFVNRENLGIDFPLTYIIVRKYLLEDIIEELKIVIRKLKNIGFDTITGETLINIDSWE